MDIKHILKLLGDQQVPGDEVTSGFLADALSNFAADPAGSRSVIRQLQAKDSSGFALAAVRLLVTSEEKSPGLQYIAGLITAGAVLLDPLLDERLLPLDVAVPLARKVTVAEPLLDVHLVRKMMENVKGDVNAISTTKALHGLGLVGAISDCSRLTFQLVQFARHPSAHVRSKAVLLLGRANWNLNRIKGYLEANDDRVRANAIESSWHHDTPEVLDILWKATNDRSNRVVVNALLGLCQAGDREAYARVYKLAGAPGAGLRSGAAWAMGEIGDMEFEETLEKLEKDGDAKVRAMAEKSRKKLRLSLASVPQLT